MVRHSWLLVLLLTACGDDEAAPPGGAGSGGDDGGGGAPVDPAPVSAKATVKLKSRERLVNDFQKSLALSDADLCKEVGTYACSVVHGIALGGVDAYDSGIYEPLPASAVTTPIAVDRLALSMCQTRAHIDLADTASAVIFRVETSGGALDPDHDTSVAAIGDLFRRIHLREPRDREVELLQGLYRDIDAGGSPAPAEHWAALACYSVLTMMESVFY